MTPSPAPSLFHSTASCAPNSSLWLLARTAQLRGVLVRRVSATTKVSSLIHYVSYSMQSISIRYIMLPKVQHHAQKSSHEPPPTWSQASTEGADHLCCTRVICDITLDSSKRPVHFSVHVRLQLLHLARVTCDTRNKKGALSKCSPHLVPVTGEPIQKNQGEPTSGDDVNVRREKKPHCSQHCGGWTTHEKRAREIKPEKNGEKNVENAKQRDELHFA
jgi:hypothetical protein